jgi:large subunit ribosomal protein L25
MLEFKVEKRGEKDQLDTLRKKGMIPAVYYGKKQESTPVSVPFVDFLKVWKKAGESTVVTLKDGDESHDSLIHDIDLDPVTGNPRHADFYVFEKGHKLKISVPVEFIGTAPGVKDLGGVFVKVMHELKIEAMPKDLPHQIDVDISTLEAIGSQILAKDVKMPQGVDLLENIEEVVALIAEPKKEEEVEVAPIDLSSIEVEKKGKEAKEGEEGGEAVAEGNKEGKV